MRLVAGLSSVASQNHHLHHPELSSHPRASQQLPTATHSKMKFSPEEEAALVHRAALKVLVHEGDEACLNRQAFAEIKAHLKAILRADRSADSLEREFNSWKQSHPVDWQRAKSDPDQFFLAMKVG